MERNHIEGGGRGAGVAADVGKLAAGSAEGADSVVVGAGVAATTQTAAADRSTVGISTRTSRSTFTTGAGRDGGSTAGTLAPPLMRAQARSP